jgi:hypothetical protein
MTIRWAGPCSMREEKQEIPTTLRLKNVKGRKLSVYLRIDVRILLK